MGDGVDRQMFTRFALGVLFLAFLAYGIRMGPDEGYDLALFFLALCIFLVPAGPRPPD